MWLFKKPRPDTGEAWAEKISAEVGELMDLPCARIELATYEGGFGTVSLSFADAEKGLELVHGNERLPIIVTDYEKEKKYHQSDHTHDRIMETLKGTSVPVDWSHPTIEKSATDVFAGYLTLDALIGNTDRHHENWGILLGRVEASASGRLLTLSPTYDHASSLDRELRDEKRVDMLQKGNLPNYVERPRSPIYWDSNDKHAFPQSISCEGPPGGNPKRFSLGWKTPSGCLTPPSRGFLEECRRDGFPKSLLIKPWIFFVLHGRN